jgi:hypothetical protein
MINTLELVSISDFVLSALCLFLSGFLFGNIKSYASPSGLLSFFLLFIGLAAFMGGIDHGFFEPIDQRYIPRTLTYLLIAAATFVLFKYTISTYFKGPLSRVLLLIAYLQLITFVISSFFYHHFLLVVGNYSPILILFFIMNVLNIKRSKSELNFTLFCLMMIIATLVQVLEIKISDSLNGDTLFHIIAFIAYLFMFKGVKEIPNSGIHQKVIVPS